MVQACVIEAGATIPGRPVARAASSSRWTGLRSPIASTQWRIIGTLTGSGPGVGGRTSRPANSISRFS